MVRVIDSAATVLFACVHVCLMGLWRDVGSKRRCLAHVFSICIRAAASVHHVRMCDSETVRTAHDCLAEICSTVRILHMPSHSLTLTATREASTLAKTHRAPGEKEIHTRCERSFSVCVLRIPNGEISSKQSSVDDATQKPFFLHSSQSK